MNIADVMTVIGFVLVTAIIVVLLIIGIYIFFVDRTQRQHPVLRNYPIVGRARYFFEKSVPNCGSIFSIMIAKASRFHVKSSSILSKSEVQAGCGRIWIATEFRGSGLLYPKFHVSEADRGN